MVLEANQVCILVGSISESALMVNVHTYREFDCLFVALKVHTKTDGLKQGKQKFDYYVHIHLYV